MINKPYFETEYDLIIDKIQNFNPQKYAFDRNYIDGSVSFLSPYLTHGVINLNQVLQIILLKYSFEQSEKFIFELAWKEYFSRTWENLEDKIFVDLKKPQEKVIFQSGVPKAIQEAKTEINAIDRELELLFETGYMHNHARMWLAGTVCNICCYNWKDSAKWLYYYLLDGDLASNYLSWQWVCGTSRNKIYFANQENINKYSKTVQTKTFLDKSYEELASSGIPKHFQQTQDINLQTNLDLFKATNLQNLELTQDVLLYHPWMLDPVWKKDFEGSKILIIEPSHFKQFPISDKRIMFIKKLAEQIADLKIIVAEISDLPKDLNYKTIDYPAIKHYKNNTHKIEFETRQYLFPAVTEHYPSFFGYYKACTKTFKKDSKWQKWHGDE
jgi:deoxyribodipyrimidine photo-lyase